MSEYERIHRMRIEHANQNKQEFVQSGRRGKLLANDILPCVDETFNLSNATMRKPKRRLHDEGNQ